MIRAATSSWQWASCTQARTLSFRCDDSPEIVSMRHQQSRSSNEEGSWFKTSMMNPAYVLDDPADEQQEQHSSCSLSSDSLCTAAVEEEDEDEAIVVRSLRSNDGRLFFEPESTSSIGEKKMKAAAAFDGATALAIDSADPYGDFRRSMEEMVMTRRGIVNDWGWLEEMLGWYLSANGKDTHGIIVGAFVDLLTSQTPAVPPMGNGLLFHPVIKRGSRRRQTENPRRAEQIP